METVRLKTKAMINKTRGTNPELKASTGETDWKEEKRSNWVT